MELWKGIPHIGTWAKKYFIVKDKVMVYCSKREGKVEGRVHLEIAVLDRMTFNERQFSISTGVGIMILRATSSHVKDRWLGTM